MNAEALPRSVAHDTLRLNPLLDREVLANSFRLHGRIHVRDIFSRTSADRVHQCLHHEIRYGLCTNIGGTTRSLRGLTAAERHACTVAAWRETGIEKFRFLFEEHRISLNGEPYPDPSHHLSMVCSFLNSPEFLAFAREITGIAEVGFADAQATVYRNGHFLTAHDDDIPGTNRLAAYVLGFTRVWRPEWGGLLEFINAEGEIEAGYPPGFNTLKLFRVPMSHHVSLVAPCAMAPRYSLTGWLRAR